MKFTYSLTLICLVFFFSGCERGIEQKSVIDRKEIFIEQGKELYFSHGCAVCHGKEGRGDGMAAVRFYPKPINLHDPDAYTQGNSISAIERSIKYGISLQQDSAMPKYDHLTDKELRYLAEYLKSLQIKE